MESTSTVKSTDAEHTHPHRHNAVGGREHDHEHRHPHGVTVEPYNHAGPYPEHGTRHPNEITRAELEELYRAHFAAGELGPCEVGALTEGMEYADCLTIATEPYAAADRRKVAEGLHNFGAELVEFSDALDGIASVEAALAEAGADRRAEGQRITEQGR